VDAFNDPLHPIDFLPAIKHHPHDYWESSLKDGQEYLPEENVHGQKDTHPRQVLPHLVGVVLGRQFAEHVIRQLVDDALPRLPASATALLGLHTQDGIEDAWKMPNQK